MTIAAYTSGFEPDELIGRHPSAVQYTNLNKTFYFFPETLEDLTGLPAVNLEDATHLPINTAEEKAAFDGYVDSLSLEVSIGREVHFTINQANYLYKTRFEAGNDEL